MVPLLLHRLGPILSHVCTARWQRSNLRAARACNPGGYSQGANTRRRKAAAYAGTRVAVAGFAQHRRERLRIALLPAVGPVSPRIRHLRDTRPQAEDSCAGSRWNCAAVPIFSTSAKFASLGPRSTHAAAPLRPPVRRAPGEHGTPRNLALASDRRSTRFEDGLPDGARPARIARGNLPLPGTPPRVHLFTQERAGCWRHAAGNGARATRAGRRRRFGGHRRPLLQVGVGCGAGSRRSRPAYPRRRSRPGVQ